MGAYPVAKSHHLVDHWFELPSLGGGTSIASRWKDILRQWVSRNQPDISEAWQKERFRNPLATLGVLAVVIFPAGMAILLNSLGVVIVLNTIFGIQPLAALLAALIVLTIYSYFGGLWTSATRARSIRSC